MDPSKLFADDRHSAFCVYCGEVPTTRDHAASKTLLDDPLPDDLPIVRSCHECNNKFSRDEQYLACLIDCVISGTTNPEMVAREKICSTLRHSPALAARIEAAKHVASNGRLVWKPEADRVRNVLLKLARGHVAHQFSEPRLDEPATFWVEPLELLTQAQRLTFESPPDTLLWPEIGSRAFIDLIVGMDRTWDVASGWHVLQPGRYRYIIAQPGEIVVRIVLSEYLACEVTW
jgi:hypothetical protein